MQGLSLPHDFVGVVVFPFVVITSMFESHNMKSKAQSYYTYNNNSNQQTTNTYNTNNKRNNTIKWIHITKKHTC